MITLPYEPVNTSVKAVFSNYSISGNLHRYDPRSMDYVTYYDFVPSQFGKLKAGEGYWFYCFYKSCNIEYRTRDKGSTITLLEIPGWYMVGDSMEDWSARWYYNKNITKVIMYKHKTIFKIL